MICTVYRSDSKQGLYLYLAENQEMTDLPEDLLKLIGKYTIAMQLDLAKQSKLANEDIKKVKAELKDKGYFVQLPKDIITNMVKYK